jgi:hypothetical protein
MTSVPLARRLRIILKPNFLGRAIYTLHPSGLTVIVAWPSAIHDRTGMRDASRLIGGMVNQHPVPCQAPTFAPASSWRRPEAMPDLIVEDIDADAEIQGRLHAGEIAGPKGKLGNHIHLLWETEREGTKCEWRLKISLA